MGIRTKTRQSAQKCFLSDVFGVGAIESEPIGISVNALPIGIDERLAGFGAARQAPFYNLIVGLGRAQFRSIPRSTHTVEH